MNIFLGKFIINIQTWKIGKKQLLEFEGKKNFHEAKWSWPIAILIVKYFLWIKLGGKSPEGFNMRRKPSFHRIKETEFPSNKHCVAGKQRTLVVFSFISWTLWQNCNSIKRVEWRDYEKIQIDNLWRTFERKTEFPAKENVMSCYKAPASDSIFIYDKNNLYDNPIDHFSCL